MTVFFFFTVSHKGSISKPLSPAAGLFISRLYELRTEFPTVTEALRIINHNIGSRIKLH